MLPAGHKSLTEETQAFFSENISLPILEADELYGSKLVAAMDRQHPRDIFDVQNMLERFGLTQRCIDCFVVYLAGHNRPIHEVLFPNIKPLKVAFENEFLGMTRHEVSLQSLIDAQKKLITEMPLQLFDEHKQFLVSLVKAEPDWSLLPFDHIQELPAIQWKLLNLQKLKHKNPAKFDAQYHHLKAALKM